MTTLWGIDLGGTKIEGAVFEHDAPRSPYARLRVNTEADRGYDHILGRIQELVGLLKDASRRSPDAIGFSTPGTLDPHTQSMKNCNTVCLNGKPLHLDLEKLLGVQVRLQNDANCFALTEATFGAARGAEVVFGVIMGTGVGGGVVVNGSVIGGSQGIAGEWGHNLLDPSGPACYCGRKGCVEMLLAGPRIEGYYRDAGGESLPLSEIAARAVEGTDLVAVKTIDRLTSLFSRAIAQVINILDPSVIVLGGGLSNIDALYSDETRAKIAAQIFNSQRFDTPVVKNKLGDSAGVFGAGYLHYRSNE